MKNRSKEPISVNGNIVLIIYIYILTAIWLPNAQHWATNEKAT